MANRRPLMNSGGGGRRMDFGRNDRVQKFGGRSGAPVSPWQGNAPTTGMNSLLPMGGNSTEATLALANNLISNLLQQRQNPVPSLLDMPMPRRDFGGNMDGPRYDRQYNPQRMGNQGNFRRPGNYGNQNQNRDRSNSNNRRPFRPNDGPRANKNAPRKDSDNKAKANNKSDTTPKKKEAEKKVEAKVVSKEKPEETAKGTETSDSADKTKDDGKQKDKNKTPYDDINQNYLKCHICNKNMWDGRSFQNHINGRAHAIMMQKTAESYALTADTMRQELKIREMKRTRRTGKSGREFYCAMCDLYAAEGVSHRTTVGHRKLKKYLHPNCAVCHKEMPTRIELDEHRLSAEHLKMISQKSEAATKPKTEVMIISTMEAELSYVRVDRDKKKKPTVEKGGEEKKKTEVGEKDVEGEEKTEGEENAEGEEKEVDGEAQTEEAADADGDVVMKGEDEIKQENGVDHDENAVLDYTEGDDMSGVTAEMIPHYDTSRGVARSFLSEFKCVQCTLCKRLLDTEETAEVHLKTWRHYLNFVRMVKEKAGLLKREDRKRRGSKDESMEVDMKKVKSEEEEAADQEEQEDEVVEQAENGQDGNEQEETLNESMETDLGEGEWESTVDEILKDEENEDDVIEDSAEVVEAEPELEPEPEPEPEPVKEPEPKPVPKPVPSPKVVLVKTAEPVPAPKAAPVKTPDPSPVKEAPKTPTATSTPTATRGKTPVARGRGRGRGRRGN